MEPILRPLWFDYPEDPKAFLYNDQFLLGSEYIVAPILEAGVDYRNVYLPQGKNTPPGSKLLQTVFHGKGLNEPNF